MGDIHLSIAIGMITRMEFEKLKENGFSYR
jgi:hypothetical protein